MLAAVKELISRHNLLARGDKVIVACSGGPDSLVLLHILLNFRQEYDLTIIVAHLNHMFRPEADSEAEFVRHTAESMGLVFEGAAIDVPRFIAETGRSAADGARAVRYQFLHEVAARHGAVRIATGHHSDDQAETVLLHLLRGAGGAGLAGMKPVNGAVIRPLLAVSRSQIEAYCRQYNLTPVQDMSNYQTDYLRNKIRLELIPYLQKMYNPAIRESLCRTAQIIGDEHEAVAEAARRTYPSAVEDTDNGLEISTLRLAQLPVALQREVIRLAIEKKQGHVRGIKFLHVENLINTALRCPVGTTIVLPGRLTAVKGYKTLVLSRTAEQPTDRPTADAVQLSVPGITIWNGWKISACLRAVSSPGDEACRAVFDFDAIEAPLMVRGRQRGDRFQPDGLKGSKKLKEFFIDQKIPRSQRDTIPLICDRRGILWVAGYRRGEGAKVIADTCRVLQIHIEQEDSHAE